MLAGDTGLPSKAYDRESLRALGQKLAMDMPALGGHRGAAGTVQVVDLFCGAGGLSAGFEIVGRAVPSYRLAAAADFDPASVLTYSANLPIAPACVDLAKVGDNPSDFVRSLGLDRSAPVVVLGGPPCQGFSAHRKKDAGAPDTRNGLIEAFAKICLAIQPDFVVFENVPEVTSKKHWKHFEKLRRDLEAAGYFTKAQIHNLASFGVPQARFRTLLIAGRKPFEFPVGFLQASEYRTVRQAIGHLPAIKPGVSDVDPMHVTSKHRPSTIATIAQVPADGGSRPKGVGPRCLQEVDGFRDVYGRLYWERPANTITGFARNPASGRFAHPAQNRGLSIREAALLQGFPPDYEFQGPMDARFLQVGNAVPPVFAVYLAAHLLGELMTDTQWSAEGDVTVPNANSFSSGLAGRKKAA